MLAVFRGMEVLPLGMNAADVRKERAQALLVHARHHFHQPVAEGGHVRELLPSPSVQEFVLALAKARLNEGDESLEVVRFVAPMLDVQSGVLNTVGIDAGLP